MNNSYRILSLEAAYVYINELKNGKQVGCRLPRVGTADYFRLFVNRLDYSLDTIELERVFADKCSEPFAVEDQFGNLYTQAVINVKFSESFDKTRESIAKRLRKLKLDTETASRISVKELRENYYRDGFWLEGRHYVRYKRSAGSSRDGKCLFIDERLYDHMMKWSECGLAYRGEDLASWEAYKALSLSSLKGTLDIPLDGILLVPDRKSEFTEDVVSVELRDGRLVAESKVANVVNDVWDGESLLDDSLFTDNYATKHMLLLRNKFFKSCAFRTKLKKWLSDKGVTVADLKARGCFTLATDVRQIVMVTTPNSLKYVKFAGGPSEAVLRSWAAAVGSTFGVVKWDKRTRFFGGRMVRSSYQLLNTLGMTESQAVELVHPGIDYLALIREDVDFMNFHFSYARAKESDEVEGERDGAEGLEARAAVMFKLMKIDARFHDTELYRELRNDVVEKQKADLRRGHLLLGGTNATLFGNGPELLLRIAGEDKSGPLKPGQIRCGKFAHGQKLLCARSPHVTMGNLYCVENNLEGDIWDYFDLGENVVCVNAVDENIQQKLNGCDYDSDTMLVTDDPALIEVAERYGHLFKVPVCRIESRKSAKLTLAELDYNTGTNRIGGIINLSQKLNSFIWDRLRKGNEDVTDLYLDVCKLAVLSGIEIDRAKRAYDGVDANAELAAIKDKYRDSPPQFFREIDKKAADRFSHKAKNGKKPKTKKEEQKKDEQSKNEQKGARSQEKEYADYDTTMEYVYKRACAIDFRYGKPKHATYTLISEILKFTPTESPSDIEATGKIIEICNECVVQKKRIRREIRQAGDDDSDVYYDMIADLDAERDRMVNELLVNENILYLVIKYYEQIKTLDWNLYAPILGSELFEKMLKAGRKRRVTVVEDQAGDYKVYKFSYSKSENGPKTNP